MRLGSLLPEGKIVEIVQQLASCDAVPDVVRVLATSARRYVGADGVTVVMRDGDRCRYLDEDAIGALWKGQDFPAEACVSGWAMRHSTQAVIPDIRDDPRIPQAVYAATFVRSMVMTPIECDGEVIGALGAYWDEVRMPTEAECAALRAVANSAALALVNVRLLAELRLDDHRKEQFLEGLANELGGLLGPLRTSLHAQRHSTDAEVLRRAGDVITRQLARHARLIDHLRDGSELLSGRSEPAFWPIDLADPIARAIAARREAAEGAEVDVAFPRPGTPLPVLGDERRLAQAFGHIFDNSLRFTPPGGRVVVTTHIAGRWIVAEIVDTGVGIADDVLPRLFEPFYRPTREPESSVSGVGLGLSMVARIAKMHGGSVAIHSDGIGQGTRVTLRVPLLDLRDDAPA
jgi:two-component system CheB/CheR fusion protein